MRREPHQTGLTVLRLAAAAGVAVLALTAPRVGAQWDVLVGVSLSLSAGLLIIAEPRSLTGDLLTLTGLAWFAGNFANVGQAAVATIAVRLAFVHRALLTHAIVSFPSGRVRRATIGPLAVLYLTCIVPSRGLTPPWLFAWAIGAMLMMVLDYAGRPPRQRAPVVLFAGGWWVGSLILVSLAKWTDSGVIDAAVLSTVYSLGVAVSAGLLAVGALRRRHRRSSLTDALLHLTDAGESTPRARRTVRDGLASALGDPDLEVLFAAGSARAGWIDELGRPTAEPDMSGRRKSTAVTLDGQDVALIVHDPGLADDPRLVEAIQAATTLAATNVRLRAQLVAEVEQLTRSRSRMASAATEARERLGERIRMGAAAHLSRVDEILAPMAHLDSVDGASARESLAQLAEARRELASLAAGLGPAVLVEQGLERAIRGLTDGLVPAQVAVGAVPDDLVTPVYLMCAECVSNAMKHANASHLRIEISSAADSVIAVVSDDGGGGVELGGGSGLRGVIDRVALLGGTVGIQSSSTGTQVTAVIPIRR